MKTSALYILICSIALLACKNDSTPSQDYVYPPPTEEKVSFTQYQGLIGPDSVIFTMQLSGELQNRYSGRYSYHSDSDDRSLTIKDVVEDSIVLVEWSRSYTTKTYTRDSVSVWVVAVTPGYIVGRKTMVKNRKSYHVDLQAEKPQAGYQLVEVSDGRAKAIESGNTANSATAVATFDLPSSSMSAADSAFLEATLLRQTHADTSGAKSMREYLPICIQALCDHGLANKPSKPNDRGLFDHDYFFYATCLSYFDGILTYEISLSEKDGGAPDKYVESAAIIDMKEKKVWALNEIMQTNDKAIETMLDDRARLYFGLGPHGMLKGSSFVKTFPLPAKFIISQCGINFCYAPDVVAPGGFANLYLSYKQLMPYLSADFKRRMKLR